MGARWWLVWAARLAVVVGMVTARPARAEGPQVKTTAKGATEAKNKLTVEMNKLLAEDVTAGTNKLAAAVGTLLDPLYSQGKYEAALPAVTCSGSATSIAPPAGRR